jgi:hypothetical protein
VPYTEFGRLKSIGYQNTAHAYALRTFVRACMASACLRAEEVLKRVGGVSGDRRGIGELARAQLADGMNRVVFVKHGGYLQRTVCG